MIEPKRAGAIKVVSCLSLPFILLPAAAGVALLQRYQLWVSAVLFSFSFAALLTGIAAFRSMLKRSIEYDVCNDRLVLHRMAYHRSILELRPIAELAINTDKIIGSIRRHHNGNDAVVIFTDTHQVTVSSSLWDVDKFCALLGQVSDQPEFQKPWIDRNPFAFAVIMMSIMFGVTAFLAWVVYW